jgi:hypothetical protein
MSNSAASRKPTRMIHALPKLFDKNTIHREGTLSEA